MDSKMNDLMRHSHGPKITHYIVNDSSHMTDYMINFEFNGLKKFIKAFFYEEKHPMKVLSRTIGRVQNACYIFLKENRFVVDLQLETEEMREHPEKYEPKQQCQNIMNWLNKNQLRNITFECATFKSDDILKTKLIRSMTHNLNLKVHKMFDLAMSLPPMYTMTMLKLSEDYTNIPFHL